MDDAIAWYQQANEEEREEFLEAIGAYGVSEQTWYINPYSGPVFIDKREE